MMAPEPQHIKTNKAILIGCFTGLAGIEFVTSIIDSPSKWVSAAGKSGTNKSDRKRDRKNRWR